MNNSGIIRLKSKFFLSRVALYFSFLLIPIWIQKLVDLNEASQAAVILLYIIFMGSQWFLLGKEIDNLFKIYFRVDSSVDRLTYRLFLGHIVMIIFFNLLGLLPAYLLKHFFWGTWVVLGLFYSWPTRGKIINETISSQFGEIKFLDSFEKTTLVLILVVFCISMPLFPSLANTEALKLFLDPAESISDHLWNFLSVNYFPFAKYSASFQRAWFMHFYFVWLGFFFLMFYGLLRHFFSRRLALLGLFAIVSSASYTRLLGENFGIGICSTLSLFWVWALFWVQRSSTYRSGVLIGMMGYWAAILGQSLFFLIFVQFLVLNFFFLQDKTVWYKRQLLKYCVPGIVFACIVLLPNFNIFQIPGQWNIGIWLRSAWAVVSGKAFFYISFIGFLMLLAPLFTKKNLFLWGQNPSPESTIPLTASFAVTFFYLFLFAPAISGNFTVVWPVIFLSLLPLEAVIQTVRYHRGTRNFIFVIYLMICLLDSHLELRLKTFSVFFK